MDEKKISLKQIIILQLAVGLYSISGVFNKMAALQSFPSWSFILYYGASMAVLVIYTFIWQRILRNVSLTTAYCNRPVSMVWGMMWGVLLFQETVTWNMILGTVIILAGVFTTVRSE